jgi:chaperone BCS1
MNKDIHEIKELCINSESIGEKPLQNVVNMFMVSQKNVFLIDKKLKLYASIEYIDENKHAQSGQGQSALTTKPSKNERYAITLHSYLSDLKTIKMFIEDKTKEYLDEIEKSRQNTTYVWTLTSAVNENADGDYKSCWEENEFCSSKTFNNLFFPKKRETLEKIQFFINNKSWYENLGIPHTLGIGLHGLPGTGKTSFIKALANMTRRHVVIISLKFIKTKEQLLKFFFETRYNEKNKKGSIQFKNKIIVIEDIDCSSNIVFQRDANQCISKTEDEGAAVITGKSKKGVEPELTKITLDDILNILDGIYENADRIVVITSNFYNKLDTALTRPGRIDITLELKKVTIAEISDFHQFVFKESLPRSFVEDIKKIDYKYTPAEMVNVYLTSERTSNDFLKKLLI